MKGLLSAALLLLFSYSGIFAQVGMGTAAPHPSAALDITAANKGLLMPRMAGSIRNAIINPAKGLLVFDSSSNSVWMYSDKWHELATSAASDDGLYTGVIQHPYTTSDPITYNDTCGTFYDSGGPGGPYSNNESVTYFWVPPGTAQYVKLTINLKTESPYDYLDISDPAGTTRYSGNIVNQVVYLDGANKTFRFVSNGVNTDVGYSVKYESYYLSGADPDLSSTFTGFKYIPSKAAVAGGFQRKNNWATDSVGYYSFSYGDGVKAKGNNAVSMGYRTVASGESSMALGAGSRATADVSLAAGGGNASGIGAVAIGGGTSSGGSFSLALGYGTVSNGIASTASGYFANAPGDYSTASGNFSRAQGTGAFVTGSYNIGKGAYSLVTGNYNDSILTTNETAVTANTPLFIIGNGTSSFFRSNAFAVQYNGNTYIDPSAKNTGTLAGNSLLFGAYNTSTEGISSKRTAGTGQYGLDFYTASTRRFGITNAGNTEVINNLTVQNGKGIIRNTDGTQTKKQSQSVTVAVSFTAGETKSFNFSWPEAFSGTPEAYVGNITGGAGGFAETIMTIANLTPSGGTLFVYNARTTSSTPNFILKVIGLGPQ